MGRLPSQCGLSLIVLGQLVCWSDRAQAESPAATIDLRYEAPADCPERGVLLHAIHDRAPHWSTADDRSFRVHIERDDDGYQGRLEIERKGRVLSTREIRGSTCGVVATAISVFVAIALDPAELAEAIEPPSEPERAPPPTPAPVQPVPQAPPATVAVAIPPASTGWQWGAGFGVASVLHPSVAWGGRVHGAITRFVPGAHLAPELRLSWGWADFSESPSGGGEAEFRFRTLRTEACAVLHERPLALTGCAGFEVGKLGATTRDLPRTGGTTESWYAPTAILRPAWFVFDWLSLEAELGALFPLTRASFVVSDPERTVYRIPPIAVTAAAGFRIWAPLP